MFIMMNAARYAVGVQGIAIAERAYQKAVQFSKDRIQSRPVDGSIQASAPIIHHPDVRRMLMTMRAYTEGCRALASVAASTLPPDACVLVVDGPLSAALEEVIASAPALPGLEVVRLPENRGLARALNAGLERVRTEWVVRADADDENLPDRFERQARALEAAAGELDLLGGAIAEVDERGAALSIRQVPLSHAEIARRLPRRNPFNHMTVAFRARCARDAGGYPELHLKEDYGLWAALIARGARCLNLPDVLVRATAGPDLYRRRGGLRYARSELALQRHLVRLGHAGAASAALVGLARASAFLLPSGVRGWIYQRLLRRRAG
jgi:hypothetical protein